MGLDTEIVDIEDVLFFKSERKTRLLGTGLMVLKGRKEIFMVFQPISNRMCIISMKGNHRNLSIISKSNMSFMYMKT